MNGYGYFGGNWPALLASYIGQTVTIFTSSGGLSGAGFTGVLLSVNPVFVRLVTRVGPPPGCSLGNTCTGFGVGGYGYGVVAPAGVVGAATAGGWGGYPVYTVGSVVNIPIASIVSFVHNAV